MKLIIVGLLFLGLLSGSLFAKDMVEYKSRRSYEGAPPTIPHKGHKGFGNLECLTCHSKGGYAPKYKAYAPITPHPDWNNCIQCHVPKETHTVFKENRFVRWKNKSKAPKKSVATSPPVIPHKAYQRQNCLSCHSNTKASIRPTTHPERMNCIQCHVYRNFKETKTLDVSK